MRALEFVVLILGSVFAGCVIRQLELETDFESAVEEQRKAEDGGGPYERYAWTEARTIPDGDRRGILLGPVLAEDDEGELGPVILRLELSHPYTGDLQVRLAYDADRDGTPEAVAPVEFYRSRSSIDGEQRNAVPPVLEGTFFFRDGADEWETMFPEFTALPRGGAFSLAVADTTAEDVGKVLGWAVYLRTPGTSTAGR